MYAETAARRVSESVKLLLRDKRRDTERGDTGPTPSSAAASAVAYCAAASAIAFSRALSKDRTSVAEPLLVNVLPSVRRR